MEFNYNAPRAGHVAPYDFPIENLRTQFKNAADAAKITLGFDITSGSFGVIDQQLPELITSIETLRQENYDAAIASSNWPEAQVGSTEYITFLELDQLHSSLVSIQANQNNANSVVTKQGYFDDGLITMREAHNYTQAWNQAFHPDFEPPSIEPLPPLEQEPIPGRTAPFSLSSEEVQAQFQSLLDLAGNPELSSQHALESLALTALQNSHAISDEIAYALEHMARNFDAPDSIMAQLKADGLTGEEVHEYMGAWNNYQASQNAEFSPGNLPPAEDINTAPPLDDNTVLPGVNAPFDLTQADIQALLPELLSQNSITEITTDIDLFNLHLSAVRNDDPKVRQLGDILVAMYDNFKNTGSETMQAILEDKVIQPDEVLQYMGALNAYHEAAGTF